MPNRVVVTGLGAISPCGNTAPDTWEAMVAGRSGVGPITLFDASGWPVRIAGEVKGFDPVARLGKKLVRRMARFTQFGVVASEEALADAGLAVGDVPPERLGVYVGSGIAGFGDIVQGEQGFAERGWRGVSPFLIPNALVNLCAGMIAIRLQAQGPSLAVSTACATGNHSIGEAWRVLRDGDADVVIAGGTEAAILPLGVTSFMVMRALSKHNDEPELASRPFDLHRDGFVMGEGAGILTLETMDHAVARGARIYAELTGYALNNDAFHQTLPGGGGAERCMATALRKARLNPEEIGYINAHGTSTPANDANETRAIRAAFKDHADQLMVSSTKGVTGHLLGAAGGVEAVATVMAIHQGVIPPTASWRTRDPECDLDYVPVDARDHAVDHALTNAFGFGGTNASLIFSRFTG
jgi:3-oxoacyl-[acyl-carrier-protein] synthase II